MRALTSWEQELVLLACVLRHLGILSAADSSAKLLADIIAAYGCCLCPLAHEGLDGQWTHHVITTLWCQHKRTNVSYEQHRYCVILHIAVCGAPLSLQRPCFELRCLCCPDKWWGTTQGSFSLVDENAAQCNSYRSLAS